MQERQRDETETVVTQGIQRSCQARPRDARNCMSPVDPRARQRLNATFNRWQDRSIPDRRRGFARAASLVGVEGSHERHRRPASRARTSGVEASPKRLQRPASRLRTSGVEASPKQYRWSASRARRSGIGRSASRARTSSIGGWRRGLTPAGVGVEASHERLQRSASRLRESGYSDRRRGLHEYRRSSSASMLAPRAAP